MSFRDEIGRVAKTPEQVMSEQRNVNTITGERLAKEDYEKIKEGLRQKAKKGEYRVVEGKRVIDFDCEYCSGYKFVYMHSEWFDGIIDKGIECEVKDTTALAAYKDELNRLSKGDEISVQLKYVFKEDNGLEQCFDIPGDYYALHKRNTIHVQRCSKYVLRCSFVF